tara:strand:- start:545 stop:1039 length:495 start_codon:yes stop_codon:yes gene_type:complete
MNLDKLKEQIERIKDHKSRLEYFVNKFSKIILIGNGGSNAIASHISVDYTKFLGKKAFSFSDAPMLTAYINDYGRDEAYKQFLSEFVDDDTFVILISSSGNSMNVVNAAKWCEYNNVYYAALSGFGANNKLNSLNANYKFWVDAKSYGVVELAHEILLHSIIDN